MEEKELSVDEVLNEIEEDKKVLERCKKVKKDLDDLEKLLSEVE